MIAQKIRYFSGLWLVCLWLVGCGSSDTVSEADAMAVSTGGGLSFATGGGASLGTGGHSAVGTSTTVPSSTGGSSAGTGGHQNATGGSAPSATGGTAPSATGGATSTTPAPDCGLYVFTPNGMASKTYGCVCGAQFAALTPPAFDAGCTASTAVVSGNTTSISWGTCYVSVANAFPSGQPAGNVTGGGSAVIYGFDTSYNCNVALTQYKGKI